MANVVSTPWSFTSTDQAATAAITSITRVGVRSAIVQLSGALAGLAANLYISVQGTGTSWNGLYRVEGLTATANQFLVRIEDWRSQLANLGAVGNVYTVAWVGQIFVQQMLWDGGVAGSLLVTDTNGNLVWNPASPAFSGTLTYMKAEPVQGLVLNTIASGTLQVSVH